MNSTVINILITSCLFLASCSGQETHNGKESKSALEPQIQRYWYNGEAELSSYRLSQARYGETHEGTAVLIFVSEHFAEDAWSKPNQAEQGDIPVMKLNFTKKFTTGIYPYSIMTSTFLPMQEPKHSLKLSFSAQEWCGHTYMELRNRDNFEVDIFSYFEGETAQAMKFERHLLEDDIWSMIRLRPDDLPVGTMKMIPGFEFLRLVHVKMKPFTCKVSKQKTTDSTYTYLLDYPELDRKLSIEYEASFPYRILSWKETRESGFGDKRQKLTTTAELIKSIRSPYWKKNSNSDSDLRKQLGLD